jgi:hypothetical protein
MKLHHCVWVSQATYCCLKLFIAFWIKAGNSDGRREVTWSYGRESLVRKAGSLKRAAIQRGSEPGSRGIAIVRSRYQATTSKDRLEKS